MVKSYFGDNLFYLRKQKNLSQDELAELLDVSRQAISKWERNESYPDTDNLIAIARFFNVMIDDMINTPLNCDKETGSTSSESSLTPKAKADNEETEKCDDENNDDNSEVDNKNKSHFSVSLLASVPYSIIITIAYLLWGFLTDNGWAIGWALYITIPVYYSIIDCAKQKKITLFNYPVFVTFIFLLFGMIFEIWHPLWIVFLTIPAYYPIADAADRALRNKNEKKRKA